MSSRDDIKPSDPKKKPRLAYSCKCGWLDLGHLDPRSYRSFEGAESLWDQIWNETGKSSADGKGFQVKYQQTQGKKVLGRVIRTGVSKTYYVQKRLAPNNKEAVALAIFQEVSLGFESKQANWFYSNLTDSGFSVEDLISNVLGFYKTVRPMLNVEGICEVVSPDASLKVWDTYGPVGKYKNKKFQPLLFPCEECVKQQLFGPAGSWRQTAAARHTTSGNLSSMAGKAPSVALLEAKLEAQSIPKSAPLPSQFDQIQPADKGVWFREWTNSDGK